MTLRRNADRGSPGATGLRPGAARRRNARAFALWFTALASLGCAPPMGVDAGPRDADGACIDDGRLEVGGGGARPRALAPTGGELDIVRGSQGGIHVVVAAWLADVPLDIELTYRLRSIEDDSMLAETVVALRPSLLMPQPPRQVRHPDLLVLDNESPSVELFDGRAASLEVYAEVGSDSVCDRRSVTLRADEDEP